MPHYQTFILRPTKLHRLLNSLHYSLALLCMVFLPLGVAMLLLLLIVYSAWRQRQTLVIERIEYGSHTHRLQLITPQGQRFNYVGHQWLNRNFVIIQIKATRYDQHARIIIFAQQCLQNDWRTLVKIFSLMPI